jgi:hypothetical protein
VTGVVRNLILVHLETVLVSVHDWCMVFTKHTICTEIILDALDGTLGDKAQVEARFCKIGARFASNVP